jgi:hypothetical protein
MPPTINSDSHPHIIAAILAHADRSTLLAVRAASRGMRDAADALLFAHVALIANESNFDRSLGFRNRDAARVALRDPYPPFAYLPWEPRMVPCPRKTYLEVMAKQSAFDQYRTEYTGFLWEEAFPRLLPIKMVNAYGIQPSTYPLSLHLVRDRRYGDYEHKLTAACVVLDVTPNKCLGWGDGIQRSPTTLVVHHTEEWSGEMLSQWGVYINNPAIRVREIIYIFHPRNTPGLAWMRLSQLVQMVAEGLAHSGSTRVTIAGLEAFGGPPRRKGAFAKAAEYTTAGEQMAWRFRRKVAECLEKRGEGNIADLCFKRCDELDVHPAALEDPSNEMPGRVWVNS